MDLVPLVAVGLMTHSPCGGKVVAGTCGSGDHEWSETHSDLNAGIADARGIKRESPGAAGMRGRDSREMGDVSVGYLT